jgi:CelD/BcsL family acetyltransferase involved in cellulose biosynthesis
LCIRDAVEAGLPFFDFLRGDEPYKYDLGGKDYPLYRMVVKRS